MEPLLIFAIVFLYGYAGVFFHIYLYGEDEYEKLGSYRMLLAILWPIVAVKKIIDLVKWIGRGLMEIYKFFIK